MNKHNWVKAALFIVLIAALFVGMVGVASAASSVQTKCYTQYFGGVKVAKGCAKATFEYTGESVWCKNPSVTKTYYQSGFSITTVSNYCSPTGWTDGTATVLAKMKFYRLGVLLNTKTCGKSCGSHNGVLSCGGDCY